MRRRRKKNNKTNASSVHMQAKSISDKISSAFTKRIERWASITESFRKVITNLLLVTLVVFLSIVVVEEILNDSVIVEPIHIPQNIESQGLTSEIVSLELIDTMRRIHNEAYTGKEAVSAYADSRHADIEVPGTKTTLRTFINYIKKFVNLNNETRISGEILIANDSTITDKKTDHGYEAKKYLIRLRIQSGSKYENYEIVKGDIKSLLYAAAQKITHFTDPILYAAHQYFYLNSIHGRPAVREIISTFSNDDHDESKAWAKYFEASLFKGDGKYAYAEKSYMEAIELNPKLADAYNDAAVLYYEIGRYDEAENILKKGINNIEDKRLKSLLYVQWGKTFEFRHSQEGSLESPEKFIEEALAKCKEATRLYADSYLAHMLRGRLYYKIGMMQKARESFELAVHLKPVYKHEIYNEWGWAILTQSNDISAANVDEAIKMFLEAQKLKPNSTESLVNLGYAYFYRSKHGAKQEKSESLKKGEKAFVEAENLHHDKMHIIYEYGHALYGIHRFEEASYKFEEASNEKPENVNYLAALGNTLYRANQPEKAAKVYARVVQLERDNADYFNWWGNNLYSMERWAEAADKYRAAIRLKPTVAVFYWNLGTTLDNENQPEEAAKAYAKAFELEPENFRHLNRWGLSLYNMERWAEAAEKFQAAIPLKPTDAILYTNLGDALYRANQPKDANSAYKMALELEPDNAGHYNSWGNTLYALERWTEAAEKYRAAIRLNPSAAIHYANLGATLYRVNQHEEAAKAYARAVELEPDNAGHVNSWGLSLYNMERWAEAAEKFQAAIPLKPTDAILYTNLGDALYRANQLEKAAEAYARAVELEPDNAEYFRTLGNILYALERWAEAAEKYRAAIRLNPSAAIHYANLGATLYRVNQHEEAAEAYARAFELEPDNAGHVNSWGHTLYALERWAEAAEKYRAAIDLNPTVAVYYTNLGDVLYRVNQTEEAAEAYAKAAELERDVNLKTGTE